MPRLVGELETLDLRSAWLDGEIVVQKADGTPDFNALQASLDRNTSDDIVYFLFDVPFFEGYDLRKLELGYRRQLLEALLKETRRSVVVSCSSPGAFFVHSRSTNFTRAVLMPVYPVYALVQEESLRAACMSALRWRLPNFSLRETHRGS